MATVAVSCGTSIGGIGPVGTMARTGLSVIAHDPDLLAGVAGTLSVRTDNDTGVCAVEEGHGILDTDTVAVFWEGGHRYGVDVTAVTDTTISINVGNGDNLPALNSEVVIAKEVTIDTDVDGDLLSVFMVSCANRLHFRVNDVETDPEVPAVLEPTDLPAGETYPWWDGLPYANPFAAAVINSIVVANGGTEAVTPSIGIAYDPS